MSQISERSPKHCANKQGHKFITKKLVLYLVTFILTILALILLVWLIFKPKSPKFSITKAEIAHINMTSTSGISSLLNTSTIHVSLQSINPSKRATIYYDDLTFYVSYNGQKIVPEISIRRFHQDRDAVTDIPVSASFQIQRDVARSLLGNEVQLNQTKILDFVIMGGLRWKIGNIVVTSRHCFSVDCVAPMTYGLKPSTLQSSSKAIQCCTEVL